MKKLFILLTLLPMMQLHASQSKTNYLSLASATCTAIGSLGVALCWWGHDKNINAEEEEKNRIINEKERINKIENNALPQAKDAIYKILKEHCDHEKPSIENRKKYVANLKVFQREIKIEDEVKHLENHDHKPCPKNCEVEGTWMPSVNVPYGQTNRTACGVLETNVGRIRNRMIAVENNQKIDKQTNSQALANFDSERKPEFERRKSILKKWGTGFCAFTLTSLACYFLSKN